MSALPKSVQQQIDTANDILKQMADSQAAAAGTAPPQDQPGTEGQGGETAKPNEQPTPQPVAEPDAQPDFKHKYDVLQGKYNAEIPRLQRQLQESAEDSRALRQRLLNLEAAAATSQTMSKPAPVYTADDITDDEVNTYGADLVDLTRRISRAEARKIVPEMVRPVVDKVKQVEQSTSQMSQTVAESKQQETIRKLAEAVPNWNNQNRDQGFLSWLEQVDPYAGQVRGQLLSQAFQGNDAARVIAFFQGYLKENAVVIPKTTTTTPNAEPQSKLEEMVAPGSPKTSSTTGAPNDAKRVWTSRDLAQFSHEKNQFVRRNPGKELPKEMQRLDRDLFRAQSEGRVR